MRFSMLFATCLAAVAMALPIVNEKAEAEVVPRDYICNFEGFDVGLLSPRDKTLCTPEGNRLTSPRPVPRHSKPSGL